MDSQLLAARARDAVRLCETSSMPKFIGFLTPEETAVVANTLKGAVCRFELFGGYDSAERVCFGVFPDWCEDRTEFWPFTAVTFAFRKQDKLTHRDFLGALMSLGITRETIGDILIEEGRSVVFLSKDILNHVVCGIDKVGNTGVTVSEGYTLPLPGASETKEINDTVASLRLDCVVAALVGCSRGKAAELIENGFVSVNSVCVEKTVKTVKSKDKITVRRVGKFVIDDAESSTRKGRIILKAKKYI